MMTHKFRRLLIVGIWALLTVAVWFLIPQPSADDDEFPKWFAVAVLEFGAPWFLSLSVALLIALSLEQRFGRMRLRILSVWTLILVCRVAGVPSRILWPVRYPPYLQVLADDWIPGVCDSRAVADALGTVRRSLVGGESVWTTAGPEIRQQRSFAAVSRATGPQAWCLDAVHDASFSTGA